MSFSSISSKQGARDAGVRAYLEQLVMHAKTPGLQYLVVDSSGTVFEHSTGWADLRSAAPMDTATTMMAYSMTKTVTAAAILLLVQNRQLGLDDPASRYLAYPGANPYDASITIRELLCHTSGCPNPIPLRWIHAAAAHASFNEADALDAVLQKYPRAAFPAGTRYAYSNIGYWLLGRIIECVVAQGFQAYVTGQVLAPLSITPQELGFAIPDASHHACGYLEKYSLMNLCKGFLIDSEFIGGYDGSFLRINSHYPNGAAFGGLVATARGLGKFLRDQLCEQSALFTQATRSLFQQQQGTRSGQPIPMTLGWHIGHMGQRGNSRFLYKEGGGGGFHHMMRWYPASGLATVLMSNTTGLAVSLCLNKLDEHFIAPP